MIGYITGTFMRTRLIACIVTFAINSCVGGYLAVLIVQALGDVPNGHVIRPMGLFTHTMLVSILAFGYSLFLGVVGALTGPRKLASYGLGFLTILSGLIPFGVSMVVTRLIINMRSLVLAD